MSEFFALGFSAGALVVGFVGALALAAFVVWMLLLLGVIVGDVWERWSR